MKNQLIIIFSILLFNITWIHANDSLDFRFVSYNESLENLQVYDNGDEVFDAIVIDQQNNQIIIGAKNAILRLSSIDFRLLERLKWESSDNENHLCRNQIRSFNECENYIRVLALRTSDQSLFTCGTNSYHPICIWRRSDSLSTILSNENLISGDGKSPYNSLYSSVYHLIETGEFYSATRNEPIFGVSDPLIQRSFSQGKQLRTQQHDSNWLKNPSFVRILDIGQYVYTFFREVSLEHLSCGMNIYSRVARVCKYDRGAMTFSDNFRSFSKLRLLCAKKLSNEISAFEYNELQAIYFDSTSKLIYGGFNLPKSGLTGSAICIYTVEQLEKVFKTSFLVQKSNESYWLPSAIKSETEKCESNLANDVPSFPSGLVLRSGVLQSSFGTLVFDDIQIGHLFVDQLNDLTILFVITLDGLWLRKYSFLGNQNLCLLENIPLKSPSISIENWKVNKAEFISKSREIIITTHLSVLKIPVARCYRFNTSHLCSASMDPYCTWDNHYQRCTFSINSSSRNFRPTLTCPILNITIDGSWSSWSSWFRCEQETGEKCQCHTRTCTEPTPQFDGKTCQGSSLEIYRCEVHGGWSPWKPWSTCSQTCGRAFRSRTRTCTNPEPKNNGRICIGLDREEELCPEIVCSNEISEKWSICSKSCGGGIERRLCSNQNGKCNGCGDEIRVCNEFPCPIQEVTTWSNWTRIMPNEDEMMTEVRSRFVCKTALGSNQLSLEIKSDQINYRICDEKGNDCQESDSLDQWSPWSSWSECYPSCGIMGSTETRRRTCLNNRCIGKTIQKRDCLNCPLPMKSNWSCWSDWSECSLCTSDKIYSSKKSRTRTCLTNFCEGSAREERSCSCSSFVTSFNEHRFNSFHLILIGSISFLFGCLLILCLYAVCYHRDRSKEKFLQRDEQDYFQGSTSNSSSSPHTANDSDTFTTLDQNKFRNYDSSSILNTNGNHCLKDIPSKKFNMYINPRDIHSLAPPPPPATLKRTSLMSSRKTNLDADDL